MPVGKSERVEAYLILVGRGWTQKDIAVNLGVSEKAVSSGVRYYRDPEFRAKRNAFNHAAINRYKTNPEYRAHILAYQKGRRAAAKLRKTKEV